MSEELKEQKEEITEENKREFQDLYVKCVTIGFENFVNSFFMNIIWFGLCIEIFCLFRHSTENYAKVFMAFSAFGFAASVTMNIARCIRMKKMFQVSILDLSKTAIELGKKHIPLTKQYYFMVICAVNTALMLYGIYMIAADLTYQSIVWFMIFANYYMRHYAMKLLHPIIYGIKTER